MSTSSVRSLAFLLFPLGSAALPDPSTGSPAATAALERSLAEAEEGLREGELQIAESRYRSAVLEAWLLLSALHVAEGRLDEAREAARRATTSAVETGRALQSLALVQMQMGEAAEAVGILTRLAARQPRDVSTRRLLAQALVAQGKPAEAVQELEEAHAAFPEDLELTFTLASGYLRVRRSDAAARLFGEVLKARPIPQTHVLIGRTYRDFGEYDLARAELRAALRQDPRVRRAHYYLGMIAVLEGGTAGLAEAIREFQSEMKLAPRDPLTGLRLGMALVEAQRQPEALPLLEGAARSDPPAADAFQYLGRCLLALERPAEAVAALRRALELSLVPPVDEVRVGGIHHLLGTALRQVGQTEDAARHFAEAERNSAERARSSREYLSRYLSDVPDTEAVVAALPEVMGSSPVSGMGVEERRQLGNRLRPALAQAYLNLGVMHAQARRFARAAEELEKAAAVDAGFPQVQYALGVAYFNAREFAKAAGPLERALAARPDDAPLKRMLAVAWFNAEEYAKARDLLRDDPERDADSSLQYTYGLALVRSGQAAEAERAFSALLARHGSSAPMHVVLGHAHAQQGDFDAAVAALARALELDPGVAEANGTLGYIYLRQGRLPEAERALRAELAMRPGDLTARHRLAATLELAGRPEEAVPLLRSVLQARPGMADARYLLGKALLRQGSTGEAVGHLEAAVRLDPEGANAHYQLGQAYQRLGRGADAAREFELFQRLKDKRREPSP